jgi:cell division protein FtsL
MAKVNAVLIAILLTCALLLVTSQHRARKAFIDLERAQQMARKHEVEWSQLQLEQSQLAKHSRIDDVARRELRMGPVVPERTLYLASPGGASEAAAAARETGAAPARGVPGRPGALPAPPARAGGPGPLASVREVRR